jgi:hypothetical protein
VRTHTHRRIHVNQHRISPREHSALRCGQRYDITLYLMYCPTDDKVRVLNYIALVISGLLRKISPSLTKVSRALLLIKYLTVEVHLNTSATSERGRMLHWYHTKTHFHQCGCHCYCLRLTMSLVFLPYRLLAPELGIHDPRTRPCSEHRH